MMSRLATASSSYDEDDFDSVLTPANETPTALEPPLSPPGGAESLFLAGLSTARLSAAAVASRVQSNHRSFSSRGSSRHRTSTSVDTRSVVSGRSTVATDDFLSCAENPSDLDDDFSLDEHPVSLNRLLLHPLEEGGEQEGSFISESKSHQDTDQKDFFSSIMATMYSNSKYSTSSPKAEAPKKEMPSNGGSSSGPDLSHIDAAEVVYAKAKDVWAWGKTVPVVSFFVGTTETVATKALDMAGTNFSTLDTKIAAELAKLDTGVLNPAIEAVAKALISAAAHSEETLKPLLLTILSTVGMIKSEANESNPEAHHP